MESADEASDSLERAMERAFREPALLPDFYRALLRADLFLVGRSDQPSGSERRHRITLMQWETESGERVIPVFSSLDELRRSVDEDEHVLRMGAAQLLTLGTSLPLVVDPLSEHQAVLSPDDVHALASGRLPGVGGALAGMGGGALGGVVEQGLAAPHSDAMPASLDPAPARLIDALITLLARRPCVERAWLCQLRLLEVTREQPDEAGMVLLALEIDAEHDRMQVIEDVSCVIAQAVDGSQLPTVEVITLADDPLSQRLREGVSPFYERRWGARMTDPLVVGHA
jgi:hypothetical protein